MIRSLPWLLRRLSMMPPSEVVMRMADETRKGIGRMMARKGPPLRRIRAVTGSEYARPHWFVDLSRRDHVRRFASDVLQWTGQEAEHLLQHRFSFFSFREKDLGTPIRWNYDYCNAVETTMAYGLTLDYRDTRLCGDIKYAWEHNRHHHMVELAKAHYLTGDLRFADEVRAQVESWIDESPYPFGINWASPLESALRVINWCFAFRFLEDAGYGLVCAENGFRKRWIASMHEHLRFIRRNLSHHSSANNHLIGEASGLFIGALMFRFKESKEWVSTGKEILEREILSQVWPDGVNKEQSTNYQVVVFDLVLLAALLGRLNSIPFADAVWRRLEAMAEFVAALIAAGGAVPAIGDSDDGHVVRLTYRRDFSVNRSLLATAGAILGRKDFTDLAGTFDEKSFWLLGLEGEQAFREARRVEVPKSVFPDGGYYIVKNDEVKLIFDCGPLGYLSLAAHGHADALSIILDYRGRRFFVDPGTFAYHTKAVWRSYFRGTAAHNTVRVAGLDQSVIGGNFMWMEKAEATLLWCNDHGVCGRHSGYQRLRPPALHEREVVLLGGDRHLRITDRISTRGEYHVEQFFHCDPACVCTPAERGYHLEHGDAAISIVPDERVLSRALLVGSMSPMGGWFSPGFDQRVPCPTLRFAATATGDCVLVTNIYLT